MLFTSSRNDTLDPCITFIQKQLDPLSEGVLVVGMVTTMEFETSCTYSHYVTIPPQPMIRRHNIFGVKAVVTYRRSGASVCADTTLFTYQPHTAKPQMIVNIMSRREIGVHGRHAEDHGLEVHC